MKNKYTLLILGILGVLTLSGCDKVAPILETKLEEKLPQVISIEERAKGEISKVEKNIRNNWMRGYEYFCLQTGSNTCTVNGCTKNDSIGPSFSLVKNKADSFSGLETLVYFRQEDSENYAQYCGEERIDLYSLNNCSKFDGQCVTQFDYFYKKEFSESTVFTDNNNSGHVIRINNKTKNYIKIEAVGAVGTNINTSYGKCFSYGEIL